MGIKKKWIAIPNLSESIPFPTPNHPYPFYNPGTAWVSSGEETKS